jgi:hypothetical protein
MAHIVLLGDSVFDNAVYVPNGLAVIEHLRECLSSEGDRPTLLAVDGDCIEDVAVQLQNLPMDATHLFISVGGNDALGYGAELRDMAVSLPVALRRLSTMKQEFSQLYHQMLGTVLELQKPTTLCTIYDQCPLDDPALQLLAHTALSMFNDCITRQAIQLGLPLLDLRVLCSEASDYSGVSPIEPSHTGGQKIARCIAQVMTQHDFSTRQTVCYI